MFPAEHRNSDKMMEYWKEYVEEMRHQYARCVVDLDSILTAILSEHPKWQWRSTTSLCRDVFNNTSAENNKESIERALDRLVAKGVVVQNNANPDQFGYRNRIIEELGSHRMVGAEYYTPFHPSDRQVYNPTTNCYVPETCPQSIKAAIADGLLAKPKVEFREVIDPNTFEVKQLKQEDVFQEASKCLQEIHKIITRAEVLNSQLEMIV